MTDQPTPQPTHPTHLYVLLDRSGSMSAIRAEVIGGFNDLLAGQQANGPDARITLVQFDTGDIAHTVFDDLPIAEVTPMRPRDFEPRGGTPLLDATAALIARATTRASLRAASGRPEDVVFVTITDGQENSSREFTVDAIRTMVAEREAQGWTFVFLSAALDAYDEAGSFGYGDGSVQAFSPDAGGTALAMGSLSAALSDRRTARRTGQTVDHRDIWKGSKPAESDRRRKRGDSR